MTITLEISQEAEEKLQRKATQRGIPVTDMVRQIVEQIADEPISPEDLSFDEWSRRLHAINYGGHTVPHDKQGRESIYEN